MLITLRGLMVKSDDRALKGCVGVSKFLVPKEKKK